jgi:heat shock protein HtpX
MDAEKTAQGLVDAGRIAFRLAQETPLYSEADTSSPVMEVLAPGSLVSVRDDAGPFLFVITAGDRFGYIDDGTAVTANEWRPELERRTPAAAPPEQTARDLLEAANREVTGAQVAAALAFTPMSARDDEPFTPAAPPTPSERVLIYDRIARNRRSTFILLVLFTLLAGAFFAAIGVFLSGYASPTGEINVDASVRIAVAAALLALGFGVIMYFTAPSAVMAISGAHEVTKEDEPVLYRIVENLSIGSGLPMPKVWVIEDSAPNAFATGLSPDRAHVAATRGLLDKLQKRELEGVMAHEMSHVGNYDTRLMTFLAVAVGLIALVADLLMRFTWYGAGARSSNRGKGGGALALIILAAAIILIVVSPIVAGIIRLALSRQREYLADSSGALLCRNPDALADALEKISSDAEPLEVANKATAHMYIANPLKGHESFLNSLFATHPPARERIRILRAMG